MTDPGTSNVHPGDVVRCRDVHGTWSEKETTSGIEGRHVDGRLTHDFAGVYVRPFNSEGDGVFWPLEDVEPA